MVTRPFPRERVGSGHETIGQTLTWGGESGQIPIIILCLTHQEFLGVLIDLVARGCLFWHAAWRARRLTKASLFRTRPNHVHTYFIKYPAAEYATPKTDGNLTRLSPHVRVWPARLAVPMVPISYSKRYRL